MALVDLDRELYDRTVAHLREQLTSKSSGLLLDWILREHKIETDALKAEVAGFREANGVMGPMLHTAVSMAMGANPRETEPLDGPEAMKRVQEMLDEEDSKPAETVDRSDTSGEKVEEKPAESTNEPNDLDNIEDELAVRPEAFHEDAERPKNWMQKNPIGPLNPAPIVTVEPEPFKPEGPVSGEERDRIARLIGVQNTGLAGETFCRIVTLRLEGKKPSEIAEAIGLLPHLMGPHMGATERHVKQLAIHPREEWREEYLRRLAVACQRRAA